MTMHDTAARRAAFFKADLAESGWRGIIVWLKVSAEF